MGLHQGASLWNFRTQKTKGRSYDIQRDKTKITQKASGIKVTYDFSPATLGPSGQWNNLFKIVTDSDL